MTSPSQMGDRNKYPLSGTSSANNNTSSSTLLPAAASAFGVSAFTSNASTTPTAGSKSSYRGGGGNNTNAASSSYNYQNASYRQSAAAGEYNSNASPISSSLASLNQHVSAIEHNKRTTSGATTTPSGVDATQRSFRQQLAVGNNNNNNNSHSSSSSQQTITSAAARAEALEAELERIKRRNQALENELVDVRRDQHAIKLEKEQERVATAQRHLQDLEIERDRVKQTRDDDERRANEQIGHERRRTEEIGARCRTLEESLTRMQNVLVDKEQTINELTKKASDTEVKLSDQIREMQTSVRSYEAKITAMNQVVESRGQEVDGAQQQVREAEQIHEQLRRQIRDIEERKADLQAENGKLEVQAQSSKQDFKLVQHELQEERDRRAREQNALVAAAEKQRDEMRNQDSAISELREDLRRKGKEIHERDLELQDLRSSIGEQSSEIQRLNREVTRWEKRAEENGSEYHQQVMKNNDLEAQLAASRTDVHEGDVRAAEASELITKLREHIGELKDELSKSISLSDSYKSQLGALDFAHQQLRSQSAMIERCENDLEAREKKIRELAADLHSAEEKGQMVSELLVNVKQLETELHGKSEYAETILNRLDAVKNQLEVTREDLSQREQHIERLNIRLEEFEGALRERDDRVYVLERDVASKALTEQNCATLESSLGQRTRELEKSFEELSVAKHRILDLEQHLSKQQDYEVTIKRLDTERVMMHNEKESLQAQVGERDGEIRNLRMNVEEKMTEIESRNVDISKLKRELEMGRRVEAERAALKDRVGQLESNLTEVLGQLRGSQSANESLHADNASLQQLLSQSKIEAHEAREKLDHTKRALDDSQVENGRLNVQAETARHDCDKSQVEKQNALARLHQHAATVDQLRAQLNESLVKESKAQHAAENIHAELRHKHQVAEDYSRQLTEIRRQLAQRETNLASLEEDNSNLRATTAKMSVMEGKVNALERLVQDKDSELDRLTLHSRQQQDQLTTMSQELSQAERASKAAQEVRRKSAALQDELDQSQDNVATLRQQLQEKERAINNLQNQVRDCGSDIENLRKREKAEAEQRENLDREVRRLKICEGEAQGMVQVLKSKEMDIESLRSQNQNLLQKIGELEESVQRNQKVVHENAVLDARMKSRDETVNALEKEMNQRAQHNRELTSEVEHLTQSMRKLQVTADSLKESRDISERENKGLRDRVEFLARGTKEDTLKSAAELEQARAAAEAAKQELTSAREKAHQLQLVVSRQGEQLSAGENRFDILSKELAAAKSELSSLKIAYEERGSTVDRLTEENADTKRRAYNASDVVSTLQQSANENALRNADERNEATKTIDRLERSIDELKSQLHQRNAMLTERGRTLSMTEERLRDCENELRRANEQKTITEHRVRSLEDDIGVLQRSNDMATARRKAAELSLHDADDKLNQQSSRYKELDRISSFERQTHADREAALKREADRLGNSEKALRNRTQHLEQEIDELRSSPIRSPGGGRGLNYSSVSASSALASTPRQQRNY